MTETLTRTHAIALDAADPLRQLRGEFIFPQHQNADQTYFVGNSLGLQPRGAKAMVQEVLDLWARHAVEGHFTGPTRWMNYHRLVAEQLARVVGNLLSNAAKHTPVGTTVTASVRQDQPRPGFMLVSVHDDGGGIPADRHATLFHRFVRGPGKGRTSAPGTEPSTGLGLAIVRQIIDAHGGHVHAENRTGPDGAVVGARFEVRLPATGKRP